MADPRIRPVYPPQSTAAPAPPRDRDFNAVFNPGRPVRPTPPPQQYPPQTRSPDGPGYFPEQGARRNPNAGRGYPPPQQMNGVPQRRGEGYQGRGGEEGRQGGYSRQYGDGPPGHLRGPQEYAPRGPDYPPQRPSPQEYPPRGPDYPPQRPSPQEYPPRSHEYFPRSHEYPPRQQEYPPQRLENDYPQRPPNDYPQRPPQDYPPRPPLDHPPRPPQEYPIQRPPQEYVPSAPLDPYNRSNSFTAAPRSPPKELYSTRPAPISSPPAPEERPDRSYSLTSSQPAQRRQDDRSYTLSSATTGNYAATRVARAPDQQGRSMSLSSRYGGTKQAEITARPRTQQGSMPPSPRRGTSSRQGLTGVQEETSRPGHSRRQVSVDSTHSDTSSHEPNRTVSISSATTKQTSLPTPHSSISRSRAPIVYPTLLSRVAIALRERLVLGDKQKDGLTYPNAFTGSEAVDLIAFIIKTSDRNLALLLGRALDAQRWFHDVTYVHRYMSGG
jgi:RHO1 GDP-GTP exchange protein 1/2